MMRNGIAMATIILGLFGGWLACSAPDKDLDPNTLFFEPKPDCSLVPQGQLEAGTDDCGTDPLRRCYARGNAAWQCGANLEGGVGQCCGDSATQITWCPQGYECTSGSCRPYLVCRPPKR